MIVILADGPVILLTGGGGGQDNVWHRTTSFSSISPNVRRHDGAGERDGSLIGIDLVPSE